MMEKEKEIKKLRAQKTKFRRQGNLKLVAEYANSIGNLCSEIGNYRQAIEEHESELSLCKDLKDVEGQAVANRKLGECYMELVELEPAKQHVNNFLELAKLLPNKVELQRAYVTMGRLCLVEIPTLIAGTAKRKQSEKKSESAFMKALEVCDKIKDKLNVSEYQQMRSGAILNLGLLADLKGEEKEAIANFRNAATIARKHGLYEPLVTSLNNRAELLARKGEFTEARAVVEEALECRKHVGVEETVTIVKLLAQVTAEMGDVGVGLDMIKPIIRSVKESVESKELMKIAVKLYKIILAKRKVSLSNDNDKREIFEKIGDYCCDLGAYHHALLSYKKTLDIMNELKANHKALPPILISMARTYQDLKNYDQAINYYCQEAKIQQQLGKFEQAAATLLNVANCMENGNSNIDMIQQCYKKAENHARNANDPKLLLSVLKNCRDSLKALECMDKHEDCCRKIEQLTLDYGLDAESQDDESQVSEVDGDDSSDGGFELSDHSSDEERETEVVNSHRCRPFKLSRNEIGETKLHQAVIKGKIDVVKDLLNKGHPTDMRDHAGWLPIHEAAVHNHVEIARILVDHGTDINDRAGREGITPLHDACSSGCTEMLQFLMESGASVIAKDNDNLYPLDHLVQYLHRSYADPTNDEKEELEDLESMLRTSMIRKGITPKGKSFREELQEKEDDIASEMPEIVPHYKQPAADEGDESLPPEDLLPVDVSPRVSATELYKSAVANVRKSAKRVAVPYSSGREKIEVDSGPSLLPEDCDKNMLATGDWLIDDYTRSPIKKKQRVSRSTHSKASDKAKSTQDIEYRNLQSSPSIVDESPLKLSPTFVEADEKLNESAASDRENVLLTPCSSISSPQVPRKSSHRPLRKRIPLAPVLPIMDEDTQPSQPLTPAFGQSAEENENENESVANENPTHEVDTSPMADLKALLDEPLSFQQQGGSDETDAFKADSDTQIMARSQSPDIITGSKGIPYVPGSPDVPSAPDEPDAPSDVEERMDELLRNRPVKDLGNSSMEWTRQQPNSPDVSVIHMPTARTARNKKANIVLDEFFSSVCDQPEQQNKKSQTDSGKPLPTSTPLRKIKSVVNNSESAAVTGQQTLKRIANAPPVDSGPSDYNHKPILATPILPMRALHRTLNDSTTDSNSTIVHNVPAADLNSSYYRNIRIAVQFRNRCLLIPVPRSESPSIGWLGEESLKRLSKRKSTQNVPQPDEIFITRASDGAELFADDAILDLLVDNEKVVINED